MPSHFVFFAGKGGVGKTTCAAAHAVHEARLGQNVLIVSTDPAHSLGDVFGAALSARPSFIPVKAAGAIRAVELDAPRAFARWLGEHRHALGDIIEHGTLLDRDDVQALLGLSIPGIDELVAMLELSSLGQTRPTPDLIVVDTAPTGHALRLLAAPDAVRAVADALGDLQSEHRMIRRQFAHASRPEAADRLIALLTEQAVEAGTLLRDRRFSEVHWVMAPEELSLAETRDGLRALDRASVHATEIIVNRTAQDGPSCPICDRRRAAEREVVDRVRRSVARHRGLRIVPAEFDEPRGCARLAAIGRRLHARVLASSYERRSPRTRRSMTFSLPRRDAGRGRRLNLETFDDRRVIFVGGKGGVGKTTVAASLATALARREPARRVLLLSTDPAHSLADVFDRPIGNRPRTIAGGPRNLRVRELDAAAALAERRSVLEAALSEIAEVVGHELTGSTGQGVSELIQLAPPGIDELLGLLSVAEVVAQDSRQTVVVDTAPTGHTLRLLEMPDVARAWVQVLMRVLLKYRRVVRPERLATELVDLSRSIREFLALMADPARAQFLVVTRAEALPRLETERLLKRLVRLRLAVPSVVVNALTLAPGRCPRCVRTRLSETRELARLMRTIRRAQVECAIIQTPLAAPPPRGLAALERWAPTWIAEPTSTV